MRVGKNLGKEKSEFLTPFPMEAGLEHDKGASV